MGYFGTHHVHFGAQSLQVGFGLLKGFLTHCFFFEQCALTVQAVLHEFQLCFEFAQLCLLGCIVNFGQQLSLFHVGSFGKMNFGDFSGFFKTQVHFFVGQQTAAHFNGIAQCFGLHHIVSHGQHLVAHTFTALGGFVEFGIFVRHKIAHTQHSEAHSHYDHDTPFNVFVHISVNKCVCVCMCFA